MTGDHQEAFNFGKIGDEVFREAVSEIPLLRIAAQGGKRQHGNRSHPRQYRNGIRLAVLPSAGRSPVHPENPNGAGNVLQQTLTLINEVHRQLAVDLLVNAVTYKHAAWLGQGLQTGGDIDPISEHVVLVSQDVLEVDTHSENQSATLVNILAPLGCCSLEINGAAHRFDGAREFRQEPVPCRFEDAPPVCFDRWPGDVAQQSLQPFVSVLLVTLHQAAVARDIRRKDDCQLPLGCGRNQSWFVVVRHWRRLRCTSSAFNRHHGTAC
ncbi:hypothetical protein D9M72_442140 [compost metagenome]